MKKLIPVILIVILISFAMQAAAPKVTVMGNNSSGPVESISMGSLIGLGRAVDIMRMAASSDAADTLRMESPGGEFFLLSAYKYGVWNFAIVARSGRAVDVAKMALAQCGNCFTFTNMTNWMIDRGWKLIPTTALPANITNALLNTSLAGAIAAFASQTLATILVIPMISGEEFPGLTTPMLQ